MIFLALFPLEMENNRTHIDEDFCLLQSWQLRKISISARKDEVMIFLAYMRVDVMNRDFVQYDTFMCVDTHVVLCLQTVQQVNFQIPT